MVAVTTIGYYVINNLTNNNRQYQTFTLCFRVCHVRRHKLGGDRREEGEGTNNNKQHQIIRLCRAITIIEWTYCITNRYQSTTPTNIYYQGYPVIGEGILLLLNYFTSTMDYIISPHYCKHYDELWYIYYYFIRVYQANGRRILKTKFGILVAFLSNWDLFYGSIIWLNVITIQYHHLPSITSY